MMKNWKRLPALFLSGAMALSLCACGPSDSKESPSPSADPSEAVSVDPDASASPEIVADLSQGVLEFSAGMSPTDTLLTVNGDEVHADLFLYMLAMNCMNIQMYLPYLNQTLEDVGPTMLEESISMAVYHTLIRQKAAELGCLPTDAQSEELRTAIEEADMETNAPFWGLTDESAEFIFAMNTYYNNVLDAATHEPTAEELEDYVTAKQVFSVKHILLMTIDQTTNEALSDEEIAAKKALADDLLAQLQAADDLPAKFDELMQANSEDSGLESNPDGYVFDSTSNLVGGFREAALELEIGELSGIVETDYGYHIMLRQALTDENKAQYKESFRPDALEDLIAQWQENADITRSDALSTLDVADFYAKLAAYQQALSEQMAPAESEPVESGGVG